MPRPDRARSLVVALFAAVLWAATEFAVAGILAVVLDRDPIETPIPAYAGLGGLTLAALVVVAGAWLTSRAERPWFAAVGTGAAVYLAIAGIAWAASTELFLEQAGSPFVAVGALLAVGAALAAWAVVRRPPNAGLSGGSGPS